MKTPGDSSEETGTYAGCRCRRSTRGPDNSGEAVAAHNRLPAPNPAPHNGLGASQGRAACNAGRGNKNGCDCKVNPHKITTSRRVGEVSSKYGYDPSQFDRDMERLRQESEALWLDFRDWMMERKVDPEKLRYLFLRLHEEFLR